MPASSSGGTGHSTHITHNYSSPNSNQSSGKNQSFDKSNISDPRNGNGYEKPKSIIKAVSEIQQYYVLEKQTNDNLPREYFTIQQQLDFFNIGIKSALIEGLIFLFIVPITQALYPSYKLFFFGETLNFKETLTLYVVAYSPVVVMTLFLAAMAKYYTGKLTRTAIVSLISGRSIAFIVKGIILFFLWTLVSAISKENPNIIYTISEYTLFIFKAWMPTLQITPDLIYEYYWKEAIPALDIVSVKILFTMLALAIFPFISLFWRGFIKDKNERDAKSQYEKY